MRWSTVEQSECRQTDKMNATRIRECRVFFQTTTALDGGFLLLTAVVLSKGWRLASNCLLYTSPSPRDRG
eukprot:2853571-Amphidinium_carterae.1